jgi:hypothetical protein
MLGDILIDGLLGSLFDRPARKPLPPLRSAKRRPASRPPPGYVERSATSLDPSLIPLAMDPPGRISEAERLEQVRRLARAQLRRQQTQHVLIVVGFLLATLLEGLAG